MQGIFKDLFGSQASQGSILNLPAQSAQATQLGQGMWITTSNNTLGLSGQQITSSLPIAVQIQTDVALIKYILQRTVSNYDELVTQFNALEDIKGAEQWDK